MKSQMLKNRETVELLAKAGYEYALLKLRTNRIPEAIISLGMAIDFLIEHHHIYFNQNFHPDRTWTIEYSEVTADSYRVINSHMEANSNLHQLQEEAIQNACRYIISKNKK